MSFFKKLFTGFKEANNVVRASEKGGQSIKEDSSEKGIYNFELLQHEKDQKRLEGVEAMSAYTRARRDFVTAYRVIALIVDPSTMVRVGYRVIAENTLEVKDMALHEFQSLHGKVMIVNGKLYNKVEDFINTPPIFVPFDGTSLKKYPLLRADNLSCIKNDLVIVRARIIDDKTKDLVGFLVMDSRGQSQTITPEGLAEYKKVGFLNVKMSIKRGKPIFQAIKGRIPDTLLSSVTQGIHGLAGEANIWTT